MLETLQRINGLHVGALDRQELQAFNQAVAAGLAKRDYSGPSGILGLAKVLILTPADAGHPDNVIL